MNNPVARIVDVNLNRAGEALRTMEEYARFVVESPALASRCKTLRHALARAASAWNESRAPADRPLCNRDIAGDVGADVKTPEEGVRPDALSVAAAASRRAAEALRALSEYAKIDNVLLAAEFEAIRYGVYAVEPLLLADADLKHHLARARLYVLVTTSLCSADARTAAREAVSGGADVIQLREKEMEDGEFHALASDLAEICRAGGAIFLVNDRPHIASLVDAGGVHGGQGDVPVHLTRRILGPGKIIGRSTSGPEFAEKALADGADYIGAGPVFETNTKKHRKAAGLDYVRWVAQWGKLPYFAIGGINRNTIDAVLDAGARAVAICTGVTMADDIAAETAFFKDRLMRTA
jgi:thiamine-phosphate pyrophosphorylase